MLTMRTSLVALLVAFTMLYEASAQTQPDSTEASKMDSAALAAADSNRISASANPNAGEQADTANASIQASTEGRSINLMQYLPYAALALGFLGLGIGGAALTHSRKNEHRLKRLASTPAVDAVGAFSRQSAEAKQRKQLDDFEARIRGLEEQVAHLAKSVQAPAAAQTDSTSTQQVANPSTASKEANVRREQSVEERIGSAFASWCNDLSPLASRLVPFQTHLNKSVPEARVEAVYRDCNAATLEFLDHVPADPAEYWLVRAGDQHFLLPQPLSKMQFRELDARVFKGGKISSPEQVRSVRPARLIPGSGGTFTLQHAGELA